jgi:hypothetical protein
VNPWETLAAGLHDGRRLPFVMRKEHSRRSLWLKTGGVRTDLRPAGDFDVLAAEHGFVPI